MFKNLSIHDFRILKNKDFQIGKYVTMLAGWNATGKSTVLALLANSCELKLERGTTYNGKQFRAEFSEILKGSNVFDKAQSKRLELLWENEIEKITKTFRTGWQDQNTRFRVIPRGKIDGKISEAKFELPVIYLGLSRLYPIGETKDEQLVDEEQIFKSDEDKIWFIEKHKYILSYVDEIKSATKLDNKSSAKNTVVINTEKYDWKTNSSGQDNLSQILFAILSFKNFKKEVGRQFKGGLLIIDELEASLHPKAQEKIVNLLVTEAKHTGFQVVFTTHSLGIIENFCSKVKDDNGNLVYYYFTKENDVLEIYKDKSFKDIKEDLLVTLYCEDKDSKITVYTEDDEARWFFKKIMKGYNNKIHLKNINISCSSLIDLMNVETAFSDYLVIFDGDLKLNDIKRIKNNKSNYLPLPTTKTNEKYRPEKVLREFIFSEDASEYFEKEKVKSEKVKIEYFREHDICEDGAKKEREIYKEWFLKHRKLFDKTKIFDYWKRKNKDIVDKFINDFKVKYNAIGKRKGVGEIK